MQHVCFLAQISAEIRSSFFETNLGMVVAVHIAPTHARRGRGSVVSVLVTAASVSGALQTSAGNLRKKAAGSDASALMAQLAQGWTAADVDTARDSSGKNSLHMAAWRGSIHNVDALISLGADVDAVSTGTYNYGKSAIFYAITRCRDDVVCLLLDRGAAVRILNNKGQSPLSLAASHCTDSTIAAIVAADAEQSAREFLNYRDTHSDGEEYGDLDPRFAATSLGRAVCPDTDVTTAYSINPTTKGSRSGKVRRRNAEQDAARGVNEGGEAAHAGVSAAGPSAAEAAAKAEAKAAKADAQERAAKAQAAAVALDVERALAPLEALLMNAADECSSAPSTPSLGLSTTDAIVHLAEAAVTSLATINGQWLPQAAARLHKTALDRGMQPRDLFSSAADSSATPSAASAERTVQLRTRLLKLAASPLLQLAATVPNARASTPILPVSVGLLPKMETPADGWPLLAVAAGVRPIWVCTPDGVRRVRDALSGAAYVGIDTEWADDPSYVEGRGKGRDSLIDRSCLATIQLAVDVAADETLFVLEALHEHAPAEYHTEVAALLRWMLADTPASPQLVGFAFAGDAELIAKYSKYSAATDRGGAVRSAQPYSAADVTSTRRGVIDVQPTAIAFGVGTHANHPSLRRTYEAFLGLTMTKQEQLSDWTRRPLLESQMEYAVLDALACVRVREAQEQLLASADDVGGSPPPPQEVS